MKKELGEERVKNERKDRNVRGLVRRVEEIVLEKQQGMEERKKEKGERNNGKRAMG